METVSRRTGDDVWIYDFQTKTTVNITNNPAQDIIPMWSGNTIYFISDRDENKRLNLYSYDLQTKQTNKLTAFTDYDVKFPRSGTKPSCLKTEDTSTRMISRRRRPKRFLSA